jgi:hypothetical protein
MDEDKSAVILALCAFAGSMKTYCNMKHEAIEAKVGYHDPVTGSLSSGNLVVKTDW